MPGTEPPWPNDTRLAVSFSLMFEAGGQLHLQGGTRDDHGLFVRRRHDDRACLWRGDRRLLGYQFQKSWTSWARASKCSSGWETETRISSCCERR